MSALGNDSSVAEMISRMASAGLYLWPHEAAALTKFVRRAKNVGQYWTKLIEVYPFCGRTLAASRYKLKYHASAPTFSTETGGAFATNRYSPRTAITGPVTGVTLNTGFIPSTMLTANTSMMMCAGVQHQSDAQSFTIGVNDNPRGAWQIVINSTQLENADPMVVGGGSSYAHGGAGVGTGFYVSNRTASNAWALSRNGTQFTTGSTASATLATLAVHLMGCNVTGSGVNCAGGDRTYFAAIGEGFTATDVTNLSADYVILMQDLRRAT